MTPTITPEAVRAALLAAGFAEYVPGRMGFTLPRTRLESEIAVELKGVDLLPFNPGEGPRALIGDYAVALGRAGYSARVVGTSVIVAELGARVTATITVEMTEAQRRSYADRYGNEFAGMEIAVRLRPELIEAINGSPSWLHWLAENSTITITKPRAER